MPTTDPPNRIIPPLAETVPATRPPQRQPATPATPDSQGLDRSQRLFSDAFLPGTVLLRRYRIIERLGAGGMGTVYRAHDLALDQDVALKFLSSRLTYDHSSVSMLMNEVRLARQVSHPSVCRVHDVGELDDSRPFISMEYADGEDLQSLLRRIGRLPGDKAEQIARQLCAGLHAAHNQGVLHRDLKPSNVMLDAEGNVKITDFGIAGAIGGEGEQRVSGTPGYMAPELFTGTQASVQSDIYSLGIVLYELYTGRRLFRAESMTELLELHRRPITPPSELVRGIDPNMEELILVCLSREKERRPGSALAVLARLPGSAVLADAVASGETPSPELVAACGGPGKL